MFAFLLKRILHAIPVLLIVATITFFLIRAAPGGPFSENKIMPPEAIASINKHYGLDKPLYEQYFSYMWGLLKGDLGPSFQYPNRTVAGMIADAFPVSFELGIMAMVFAIFIGIVLGVTASTKPNSMRDYVCMFFAMIGICIPPFVLGPIIIWVFAIKFEWFNVSGWGTFHDAVLPVITLGAIYAANVARLGRAGMLEVLSQDYIRTARAKGVPEYKVILKHSIRGGLMGVVSYISPAIAGVITGSFVVESIFQIPGLGRLFVLAAFNRDYTMIMGTVLFFSVMILIFNTISDVIQILINPKRSFTEG
ncbi:MAG TPA: ABC transporter [Lentisphaeria bacterium]|nr:MAG: ABC transporter [Lentisphaerae bacterium GWF2_38_69]HBM15897.1 ABC transporter [Lentisphaeria bacterium]